MPDTSVFEPAPNQDQPTGDADEEGPPPSTAVPVSDSRMPRQFWMYATFSNLTMFGYATFGLLSFHLVANGLLSPALVPVVYAVTMAVDAVAALVSGWLYDRIGLKVLLALPVLAAAITWLGFSNTTALAVTGVLLWGAAMGVQESTIRAAVAELAPVGRRGSAYGIFTACYGVAWLLGSVLIGVVYEQSILSLAVVLTIIQAAALVIFVAVRPPKSASRLDLVRTTDCNCCRYRATPAQSFIYGRTLPTRARLRKSGFVISASTTSARTPAWPRPANRLRKCFVPMPPIWDAGVCLQIQLTT